MVGARGCLRESVFCELHRSELREGRRCFFSLGLELKRFLQTLLCQLVIRDIACFARLLHIGRAQTVVIDIVIRVGGQLALIKTDELICGRAEMSPSPT